MTVAAVRGCEATWRALVHQLGWSLARSPESWVSWDGAGTLNVAPDAMLDDDDTLVQIVLHELCHLLVEGEAAERLPDWGLDNTHEEHLWREYAALRVQASVNDRHGLRGVLVPTTDHRWFYEQLGADPLGALSASQEPRSDEELAAVRASAALAREALERQHLVRWHRWLDDALMEVSRQVFRQPAASGRAATGR